MSALLLEPVAGVDEAGRGPLAGPVVAAAVILPADRLIIGLADSKKLSPKQRSELAADIHAYARAWAIGEASVAEIDALNILNATMLAMRRAVAGLALPPGKVLIDGNRAPDGLACPAQAIVRGDQSIPCISAASIIAKTYRDGLMLDLHEQFPHHGFANHKGYGTRRHIEALLEFGITSAHRTSFAPVKHWLPKKRDRD